MSKRKLRFNRQGSHVNKYAKLSRAPSVPGSYLNPISTESDCDYFSAEIGKRYINVFSTDKERSSVESVRYNFGSKLYSLRMKVEREIIFKSRIDDFFNLTSVGFQERRELEKIKKLLEPLVVLSKPTKLTSKYSHPAHLNMLAFTKILFYR